MVDGYVCNNNNDGDMMEVSYSMSKEEYWEYRQWLLNTKEGNKKLLYYLMTRKERESPNCLDCGACCKHCPAYKNNRCSIWTEAKRVFNCDNYPLCPQALEKDGLVGVCRYYWINE